MRFGSRARLIKNTPKVNREYTVPELKKLLEASQAECEFLNKRITELEKTLTSNGLEVPKNAAIHPSAKLPIESN